MYRKIRNWAIDRDLDNKEAIFKQLAKLSEEVGELNRACLKDDTPEIIDGIGDAVVVLTILAMQHDLLIESCIESAYNEIKDRKGVTNNGIFIKE